MKCPSSFQQPWERLSFVSLARTVCELSCPKGLPCGSAEGVLVSCMNVSSLSCVLWLAQEEELLSAPKEFEDKQSDLQGM